ncbi:MAG: hypothetical protein LBC87_02055 [Fibromonadaceae bacterium]|jgi:hypothetical protein|nr:hypothetical protein [Fibromonadaceae bacterium]
MANNLFSIDLVQVAILWSIAALSVICSINANGFFRQLVSWLIVIALIVAASFFSYLKLESIRQEIGFKEFAQDTTGANRDTTPVNTVDEFATANYIFAEKQLMESIAAVSDSILSFPKWQEINSQGIEKREYYESKALFLRNNSMNFYRQIRKLSPPSEKKQSYDLLLAAADNLRLAGYEIHRQFGLEADTLGESVNKARESASLAKLVVSTITSKEGL